MRHFNSMIPPVQNSRVREMESVQPKPPDYDSLKGPEKAHSGSITNPPPPSDQIGSPSAPPWSTRTPKKLPHHPPRKIAHRHRKLTEKYEMLSSLFNGLEVSLWLLRMRKSMPIFSRISVMVESITDRRFSYRHLAQLKFFLPKELVIKKISVLDEETGCMKRDLHVALESNVIKNVKKRKRLSEVSCLRELLQLWLSEFSRDNPEGAEIPEGVLPEPFNQLEQNLFSRTTRAFGSISNIEVSPIDAPSETQLMVACHLSQSFVRDLSQRLSEDELGNTLQNRSKVSCQPLLLPTLKPCSFGSSSCEDNTASPAPCPINFSSKPMSGEKNLLAAYNLSQKTPCHQSPTHSRQNVSANDKNFSPLQTGGMHGTLTKLSGTALSCMDKTPALQPPKRCSMSPDEDFTSTPRKLVGRPCVVRSLQFDSPRKNAKVELEVSETECSDIFDIVPAKPLQELQEKERETAQQVMRRLMIARLPMLIDIIHYLFQSVKSSAVRKEALVSRLTACHSDIVDEGEIEEQLKLLQELVPEWISQKVLPSGKILFCVNKTLSPEMLRMRLAKAT